MLKRVIFFMSVVVIAMVLLSSCSSSSTGVIKASLGQEFTLPVGQTAALDSDKLKIKFDSVIGDSRCPTGVTCVWAGEATCQMVLVYNNTEYQVVFTEGGGINGSAEKVFQNYKLSFRLEPYPEKDKQIGDNDYKLILTVVKLG
jgi:hypothetical protein